MKITKAEVKIEFKDYQEACRYIALYAGLPIGEEAYLAVKRTVPGFDQYESVYGKEALREAVRIVAARNGVSSDTPVEPTWTSRKGVTMRLKDMPTRYLRNVRQMLAGVGMALDRPGNGLYSAVCDELDERDELD